MTQTRNSLDQASFENGKFRENKNSNYHQYESKASKQETKQDAKK